MTRKERIIKAYKDISFFAKYYLGMTLYEHHTEMLSFVEQYKRSLIEQSRDHGKTTTLAYVYPLWKIAFNRNIRVLFVSKTERLAKKNLNAVKETLQTNKRLIKDFGVFESKGTWGKMGFTVSRKAIHKDPTCECVGVTGAITGSRYDLIISDDVVDTNNLSDDQIQKVTDWFEKTLLPLLDENEISKIVAVGTPKAHNDLYKHLENNPTFAMLRRPAVLKGNWKDRTQYEYVYDKNEVITDCQVNEPEDWEVLWEEKQPIEKLLIKLAEIGTDSFLSEYQLEIRNENTALFKKEWLEECRIDTLPPINKCKYVAQAIDFAYLRKKTGDYTVIITIGADDKGNFYIYDVFKQRGFTPTSLKYAVIREYNKHTSVKYIFGETNNMGNFVLDTLIEETSLPIKKHNTT
ncbi:MAG: hypothetical protein GF364_12995, partial [Candidatus Lokiarchaeota archaeon]|nr:hypothetical protein [Candidatus Lokiarchaeota archaeon]